MKNVLLILIFILFTFLLFAQTPEWQWATKAGGSSSDRGYAIAIDDDGNSFVTGTFMDTATFGSYSLTSSDDCDIFIAKMDANGNWLWAAQAGGSSFDYGYGIAIDDHGNSYVTGYFYEIATFGSYSLTSSGDRDIFVAKMDANGNWLWAAKSGGSYNDQSYAITIDDNENSYITGYFSYTATFGSYSLTSSGESEIFAAKMDANGNWLWAIQAGGSSADCGRAITIDDNENSYLTGSFRDTAIFGSYSLTSNGESDIFVAKMDVNGNWLWAANAGGYNHEVGYGIAINDDGNSYVTGYFQDTATFGSHSLTSNGEYDIFIAKMDATGNWLWAANAGGSENDEGNGITIDDNGNSYVTGYFHDTATFGSHSLTCSGEYDIFVAKIDATGNWLWAIQAGGSSYDSGKGIAIDDNGNSYLTGLFSSTATFGSYSLTSSGIHNIFVAKLGNETSVENEIIPTKMELSNYPNPFNPSTTISFSIQNESKVKLSVYNIKGQKVNTLINDNFEKGDHSIIWNGDSVSSGIYFYKLKAENYEQTKKMLLLK